MVLETVQNNPWIAGYIVLILLSAIVFYGMKNKSTGVPKKFFVIHFFVLLWSGIMYLMRLFSDSSQFFTELPIYLYFDWMITTPLMLLALGLSAAYKSDVDINWAIYSIMGLQVLVIFTGLVADVSQSTEVWFAISVLLYIPLFGLLLGPIKNAATEFESFNTLLLLIIFSWIIYPILWISSSVYFGFLSDEVMLIAFVVFPLLSKAGFAFLDVYLLKEEFGLIEI